MKACPHHGGRERGQFGLDRGPEGVGEPLWRLHDNVDEIAAADKAQLGALLVQVGDGLHDLGPGVLSHPGPLVGHTIDGRLAQPGVLRDLADLVPVRHGAPFSARADAETYKSGAESVILRLLVGNY
jgi:hypothetical protein